MEYFRNPKVVGSFMIGFAIVAGAYVVSNFGEPRTSSLTKIESAKADEAPMRVFIPTTDNDIDGVEDWRDQFVTTPAVTLTTTDASAYETPKTLTGQLGVTLLENLLATKAAGPIAKPKELLLQEAVERLGDVATEDKIYDVKDIIISNQSQDKDIRNYGNAIADILLTKSQKDLDNEMLLLRDYLASPEDTRDDSDLKRLAQVYKDYRDSTASIAVPREFIKQHLDLINVYNAMYENIKSMSEAISDPMVPYIRIKRYEDDIKGLGLALTNIYDALVPHAKVFGMNDSAILLTNFSQNVQ